MSRRSAGYRPPKFLAERGFALALIDLQEPSETLAALKSRKVDSLSCTADITNETAISEFASAVEVRRGRVNVLVNNAGVRFIAPAETITAKDYRRVLCAMRRFASPALAVDGGRNADGGWESLRLRHR